MKNSFATTRRNRSLLKGYKMMIYYLLLIIATFSTSIQAQSSLLESVKRNPEEANNLCVEFQDLNSKGISANSEESIQQISSQKNINNIDAEILAIYVRGLYCPQVY